MATLRLVLLFLHLIGLAVLLGGLVVQARDSSKRVTPWVRDGAGLAFVAGVALVGVLEGLDADVNHAKIAVKLGIGLVVLVLAMVNLRKPQIPNGVWATMLVLTVVNVAVAVFWAPAHETTDDVALAVPTAVVQQL